MCVPKNLGKLDLGPKTFDHLNKTRVRFVVLLGNTKIESAVIFYLNVVDNDVTYHLSTDNIVITYRSVIL